MSGRDERREPGPSWTAEELASLSALLLEWDSDADAAAYDDLPHDSGGDPAGIATEGRPSRFR